MDLSVLEGRIFPQRSHKNSFVGKRFFVDLLNWEQKSCCKESEKNQFVGKRFFVDLSVLEGRNFSQRKHQNSFVGKRIFVDLFWKQKFLAKRAERKFHFTVVIAESTRHVITTFVLLTLSYKFTNFGLLKFNVVLKWLEIVCIRMTYISFKQSCCILKYRQKIRSIWNLPIYTAARGSTVPQYNFFHPSTSL